jgi:hypothetical protein
MLFLPSESGNLTVQDLDRPPFGHTRDGTSTLHPPAKVGTMTRPVAFGLNVDPNTSGLAIAARIAAIADTAGLEYAGGPGPPVQSRFRPGRARSAGQRLAVPWYQHELSFVRRRRDMAGLFRLR